SSPAASCSRSTACRSRSRARRSLSRPPSCRSRRASSSVSRVRWRAHHEGCRSPGDDRRSARRRSPQAQKGAVQPALPAGDEPAREYGASARRASRHRADQDHRGAEAWRREVQGLGDTKMPKRMLEGVVVSDKQDKTVVVRVERRFTHPILKKTVRRSKKYYAHDEKNEYSVGDVVRIEERRPLSRLKRWEVIEGDKKQVV